MSNNEFENVFTAWAGWASKASSAGLIIWGCFALLMSMGSFVSLWYMPSSFLYGLSALPSISVHSDYEDNFSKWRPLLGNFGEWIFMVSAKIFLGLYTIATQMPLLGYVSTSFTIGVLVYLIMRYLSQDVHSTNFARY